MLEWTINGVNLIIGILILISLICLLSNAKKNNNLSLDLKNLSEKSIAILGSLDSNLYKIVLNLEKNFDQVIINQNSLNVISEKSIATLSSLDANLPKLILNLIAVSKQISDKNISSVEKVNQNILKLIDGIEVILKNVISNQDVSNDKFDKSIKMSETLNTNFSNMLNDLMKIALEIKNTLNEVIKLDLA